MFALVSAWLGCGFSPSQSLPRIPVIGSVSPNTIPIGSASTITVAGANFVSTSTVLWNGNPRPTTFVSSTQLTAAISAADVANVGSAEITVFTPGLGIGTSFPAQIAVIYPAPKIDSITPSTADAGASGFPLTINGSGFLAQSVVRWNGGEKAKSGVSGSVISVAVSDTDLSLRSPAQITVTNPSPGGGNATVTFTMGPAAVPVLRAVFPIWLMVGSEPGTLTVTGLNFVADSVVLWNGSPRPTTYVSSTSATATVLKSDLTTGGTVSITISTPPPGGGNSQNAIATVAYPTPKVAAFDPPSVLMGTGDTSIRVLGSDFIPGAVVNLEGKPEATTFVSSSELRFSIAASDLVTPRVISVQVDNPSPSTLGEVKGFMVTTPTPFITSISPNPVVAGATTAVTITGGGFVNGAITGGGHSVRGWSNVYLDGTLASTTFIDSNTLSVVLSFPTLVRNSITVVNDFGGGTSNAVTMETIASGPGVTLSRVGPLANVMSLTGRYIGGGNSIGDAWRMDTCLGAPSGCFPESKSLFSPQGMGTMELWFYAKTSLTTAISANGRFVVQKTSYDRLAFSSPDFDMLFLTDTCWGEPASCTSTFKWQNPGPSRIPSVALSADGVSIAFSMYNIQNLYLYPPGSAGEEEVYLSRGGCETTNGCTPNPFRITDPAKYSWAGSVGGMSADSRYFVYAAMPVGSSTKQVLLYDTCGTAPSQCVPSEIPVSTETNSCGNPGISPEGRYVGYTCGNQLLLQDTCIGSIGGCSPSLITVASAATSKPAISLGGRFVAFDSTDETLVDLDNNQARDVFVFDTCISGEAGCTKRIRRVSVDGDGVQGDEDSKLLGISSDGSSIFFSTAASNWSAGSGTYYALNPLMNASTASPVTPPR